MKTVLILRHAKGDLPTGRFGPPDFNQPLSVQGREDATRIGKLLRQAGLVPDLVVASAALRARETAERVIAESGYGGEVQLTEELYLAPPNKYIAYLSELPDEVERVLVVGHNPGLEELVYQLTGSDKTLPTAALAELALPIESWAELSADGRGRLENFCLPQDVED